LVHLQQASSEFSPNGWGRAETVSLVERVGGQARALATDVTDAGAVGKTFTGIEQLPACW
jgi:hypothetical protein